MRLIELISGKNSLEDFRLLPRNQDAKQMESADFWETIYWSFFYSRGDVESQVYMLEYLRRNFIPDKYISINKPGDEAIEKTIKYLETKRHQEVSDIGSPEVMRTKAFRGLETYAPYLFGTDEIARKTLSKLAGEINNKAMAGILVAALKLNEVDLLKLIAKRIKEVDEEWMLKGSKAPSTESLIKKYNNGFNVPFDHIYGELFKKLDVFF